MSENKKPTPVIPHAANKICPICGKASYSRDGIHPQCAVVQADEPRKQKIQAEKKKAADKQSTATNKSVQKSWNKKCPRCGAEIHQRRKTCDCGHDFSGA